jgi:uncharacterized protein YdaU (DUF1376 family)
MKWYKRDPNAYFGGTRMLTPEQRGIYNDVIELLYMRDGNVPDDDRMLARCFVVRPQTWRRIKADLIRLEKIAIVDGMITAKRVANCLETARKLGVQMSDLAGKRWHINGDADAAPECKPESRIESSSFLTATRESEKRKKEARKRGAGELASARHGGALARRSGNIASPSLKEIVEAKGWTK